MTNKRTARVLRSLSHWTLFLGAVWTLVHIGGLSGSSGHGPSYIGGAVESAFNIIAGLFVALLVGTVLNGSAFRLEGPTRSSGRELELWLVFVLPLFLLTVLIVYGVSILM